jgi:hypothetical protein
MGGACSKLGEIENEYRMLVGKHERKRLLCKLRCMWEDNKMDVKEVVWESVD